MKCYDLTNKVGNGEFLKIGHDIIDSKIRNKDDHQSTLSPPDLVRSPNRGWRENLMVSARRRTNQEEEEKGFLSKFFSSEKE